MKQPFVQCMEQAARAEAEGIQLARQIQGEAEIRFKVAIAEMQQQSDLRAQQLLAESRAELTEAQAQTQPMNPYIIDVHEEAVAQAAASSLGEVAATPSDQYLFGDTLPALQKWFSKLQVL